MRACASRVCWRRPTSSQPASETDATIHPSPIWDALRLCGRSRQQFLVALFQFAVACFRVLQSAPLLSEAALQIANPFFEPDRHTRRSGRLVDRAVAFFDLVREIWGDLLNLPARSIARVNDKIFRRYFTEPNEFVNCTQCCWPVITLARYLHQPIHPQL